MHEIVETNRRIEKLVGSDKSPEADGAASGQAPIGQAPGVHM